MTEPKIWTFSCHGCPTAGDHDHRHDRDRQTAEHRDEHPDHTVNVGRIIPGRPKRGLLGGQP